MAAIAEPNPRGRAARTKWEETPMNKLDRRDFLKSTGTAAGIVATGSGVLMAADGAWAMSLSALDAGSGATLIKMARDLYPHDQIDDAAYARVVEALDKEASKDAATATLLKDGAARLNAAAGGTYAKLSDTKRLALLKKLERDAFFQKVRGAMINNFYNDKKLWPRFGYEGSSADKGGYIERGFNDLNWLPKI
jgi:hypothetical protein